MSTTFCDMVERWKALPLIGKVLSTPGLLLVGIAMIILSPIFLVVMSGAYTIDVLGLDDDDDDYYGEL